MLSPKEKRKSGNISNPLMKLLNNRDLGKSRASDKLEATLTKSLINASAINEYIKAISKFLSLFILFPMQLVIFYLFINDHILLGITFAVLYVCFVLFAIYKILLKITKDK